jgi:hypothetical protein
VKRKEGKASTNTNKLKCGRKKKEIAKVETNRKG